MSEEKFSKCEEGGEKCKCRISGVRKKNERKVPEKKSKCFGWKFLLSSCSLVGLYVNLQVKVTRKKISEYFSGECLKLKLRLQRKFKIRDFYLLGSYPLVGVKGFRCSEENVWVVSVPLVGRHVVKHG